MAFKLQSDPRALSKLNALVVEALLEFELLAVAQIVLTATPSGSRNCRNRPASCPARLHRALIPRQLYSRQRALRLGTQSVGGADRRSVRQIRPA